MTETTAVDTSRALVEQAAHNLRNQIIPPEAHRKTAADLLCALVAERDNALVMVANADELLQIKEKELLKLATALLSTQEQVDEVEAQADAACEHKNQRYLGGPVVEIGYTNRDIFCADCHRIIGTQSENTAPRRPKGQKRTA